MKSTLYVGLGVLVASGVAASLILSMWTATREAALVAVWGVILIGGAALIATARSSLAILRSDREAGVSAAQTRHLADVALLAGGFAHEARNSLNALRSRIALLRKRVTKDDAIKERVDQVQAVATSLEELVTDFLTFGRPAEDQLTEVTLAEVVDEVLEFEQFDLEETGVTTTSKVDPVALVVADRAKLKRAILNIVVNARQAMPEGGELRIAGAVEGDRAVLHLSDTGEGIPRSSVERVFEPYFTTKSEGTGLGLAIVRQTIEGFGGTITCESTEGLGTTMTIALPALPDANLRSRRRAVVAQEGQSA